MNDEKKALRKEALRVRQSIGDRSKQMHLIHRRLGEINGLERAGVVMAYSAIGDEIDLWPWMERMLVRGVTVALPRTLSKERALQVGVVHGRHDLVEGVWGILEPGPGARILSPQALDAVIVPGLVFARDGFRLGYGGGYYDRFLPQLRPDAIKVGAVYNELLWDSVPKEDHDVPVDWIVTASECIEMGKGRSGG